MTTKQHTRRLSKKLNMAHSNHSLPSCYSRRSINGGSVVSRSSYHSRRGDPRDDGGWEHHDDAASVISRQSLQPISASIRSLPREIELMDDDPAQNYGHHNRDDNSCYGTARSMGDKDAAVLGVSVSRMSIASATSVGTSHSAIKQPLRSTSAHIRSLPREIELMDDDDDDVNAVSQDSESFSKYSGSNSTKTFSAASQRQDYYFDDTRSFGSMSTASRISRRSVVHPKRGILRTSSKTSSTASPRARKQPNNYFDDVRSVGSHSSATSRHSRGRSKQSRRVRRPPSAREEDVAYNLDLLRTRENFSTDTIHVKDKYIEDPYGQRGVYTGALSKSTKLPNGKGRFVYEKENQLYEGDWIHGRWSGVGALINKYGDIYEGGFKNDHIHGPGTKKFADGRVFQGDYFKGEVVDGKMTYPDGSTYDGSWRGGMRHGRGICTFIDGSEYKGEFQENVYHGHGTMTWDDGGWYIGYWSNGEPNGMGKEIRPDGSIRHDGEWSQGRPVRRRR